jgi:hypothetical protein
MEGSDWPLSGSGRFKPRKAALGTHCSRNYVAPRVGMSTEKGSSLIAGYVYFWKGYNSCNKIKFPFQGAGIPNILPVIVANLLIILIW